MHACIWSLNTRDLLYGTSTVCNDKLKNIVLVHHYYVLIHQPTFMHLSIHTLNPTSF